jgi:hypothetical protein
MGIGEADSFKGWKSTTNGAIAIFRATIQPPLLFWFGMDLRSCAWIKRVTLSVFTKRNIEVAYNFRVMMRSCIHYFQTSLWSWEDLLWRELMSKLGYGDLSLSLCLSVSLSLLHTHTHTHTHTTTTTTTSHRSREEKWKYVRVVLIVGICFFDVFRYGLLKFASPPPLGGQGVDGIAVHRLVYECSSQNNYSFRPCCGKSIFHQQQLSHSQIYCNPFSKQKISHL